MSSGEVSANGTTYNESTVTANKDLSFASGRDTNIKESMLKGEKVTGSVGNDLNIESKQDSNSYKESSKSAGESIGIGSGSVSGGVNSSQINSNYESVTDQSGIYVGSEGFDIGVGKNTDLKGGIISGKAEAEKNKLSTGTLTFEDIENKAEYKAGSAGANANIKNGADYNEQGVTLAIGMPASGKEESKTKATISEGTIEIRDKENQKQDVNKLNRDTNNSLNKLGEIFDKKKIEERQELANLFGELAYNEIHKLADKNGWKDGSAEKNALHALVGGIMSELTGNGFLAGASASAINEMVQKKLAEQFEGEPDKHQWASAIIGGIVSQLVADNAQAGASTAASGTKNNDLDQELSTARGHLPKTESQVMDGAEQNTSDKYEITIEELVSSIFGNAIGSASNSSMEKMLSKNFPDYQYIERIPGGNDVFKIYYPSGGKIISSKIKKIPIASAGIVLVKLSQDYENGNNIDWQKEIGKFSISESSGYLGEKIIEGKIGIVVGIGVGSVLEVSYDKMWSRISSFRNGEIYLNE